MKRRLKTSYHSRQTEVPDRADAGGFGDGMISWSTLEGLKANGEAVTFFRKAGSHHQFLVSLILLLLDEDDSFVDLLNDYDDCEHDWKKVFVTKMVNTLLKAEVKAATDRGTFGAGLRATTSPDMVRVN